MNKYKYIKTFPIALKFFSQTSKQKANLWGYFLPNDNVITSVVQ